MAGKTIVQTQPVVHVLGPSADIMSGDPASTYLKGHLNERLDFALRYNGTDAAAAQATITLLAAEDNVGTNAEAIPFKMAKTKSSPVDLYEALADIADSGFSTDLNEDRTYVCCVDTDELPQGKPYVALQVTTGVAGAVGGYVIALGTNSKYKGNNMQSIL